MKKINVSARKLRYRLTTSVLLGSLFLITILSFYYHVKNGPKEDGAPKLLRQSFIWNQELWSALKSFKKLSVAKPPPPKGRRPRVNGLLGLGPLPDLKYYQIQVLNGSDTKIFPLSAFMVLPKSGYSTDFRCIEGWSEVMQYAGVRFRDFMHHHQLGRKADGKYYSYVGLETPDHRYYVSLDMESMLHDQTILAWEMNGAPLALENGAPLRLVIPIKYGIKSLKRIGTIIFSDSRPPDYWAERGYDWYSGF